MTNDQKLRAFNIKNLGKIGSRSGCAKRPDRCYQTKRQRHVKLERTFAEPRIQSFGRCKTCGRMHGFPNFVGKV